LAKEYATENNLKLIQPHASEILMPGYATIAKEIIDEKRFSDVDYIIVPSGGGALVSSIASFMKQVSPNTKVIAVEPEACTPFSNSIIKGEIVCS
jgi:threonine dehydratase